MNKEQRTIRDEKIAELRKRYWSYADIGKVLNLCEKEVRRIVESKYLDCKGWLKKKEEEEKIDRKIAELNNNQELSMNKKQFEKLEESEGVRGNYISKTKIGLCKNENCFNPRREKSAYCKECSDKHNK